MAWSDAARAAALEARRRHAKTKTGTTAQRAFVSKMERDLRATKKIWAKTANVKRTIKEQARYDREHSATLRKRETALQTIRHKYGMSAFPAVAQRIWLGKTTKYR